MSAQVISNIKKADDELSTLMRKLKKIGNPELRRKVMQFSMFDTMSQIKKQFKLGGNIIARETISPKTGPMKLGIGDSFRTLKWTNLPKTQKNKQYNNYMKKPGFMTGTLAKNIRKESKTAFTELKFGVSSFKIKISANNQKLNTETRERQYAGFFNQRLGLIPKKQALQQTVKVYADLAMASIMKGGK